MRWQAGVIDLLGRRVLGEELRHAPAILVVLAHAHGQGLRAAHDEEGVHRREDRARGVLNEGHLAGLFFIVEHDHAADAVAVAVQVFRRRVHDDVGAEFERALEVRAHERIIDDEADAAAPGDLGDGGDIDQRHHGIGRRFDEDHAGLGARRVFDVLRLARVHVAELEAELAEHLVEEPERAAVGVVADDDMIAGPQQRHHRVDGRHAGGEAVAEAPAFERRQIPLARQPRRVLRARVLEAFVLAYAYLRVGRSLIDRHADGAGRRVRFLSGVNGDGREFHRGYLLPGIQNG